MGCFHILPECLSDHLIYLIIKLRNVILVLFCMSQNVSSFMNVDICMLIKFFKTYNI